jgi:peptidoglycan hydrolase CwlO-like protein
VTDSTELKAIRNDISEMAKSVHELAIALTGYCARQDGFNTTIIDMKEDIKELKSAANKKFEKLDDRVRDVEKACGVGGVLDDINIHKQKNIIAYVIAGASLAVAVINYLN